MPTVQRKELGKITHLARIKLGGKEQTAQIQGQVSRIIDFVNQLAKINVSEEKMSQYDAGLKNIFREDKEGELVKEKGPELIEQAQKKQKGFVVVPEVFKEE